MRGISKLCPPDDAYPDGPVPTSFGDAENAYLESLDRLSPERNPVSFARSEFDQLAKYKLRRKMYREQGSLCVYCEREIAEGRSVPPIEHWCPLSCNPKLALHWKNLYLSCPSPDTCDSAKGNRRLRWDNADDNLPWPAKFQYEDIVGFTSRKFRAILKLRRIFCPSPATGCGGSGPFFRLQDVSMHYSPHCDILPFLKDFSCDTRYPCSSMSSPTATRGPRS